MKKSILPFFILISFLFISCKQVAFDKLPDTQGYGTVVIGIAGAEVRAIGENGLPVLSSAEMTIKVTKVDETLIKEKHFAESASGPRTMSLTLPAGEEIGIKVTISTASAEWKGSTGHTVKEGANKVEIKLKKSVAALKGLLFGADKPYSGHANDYTLTLKIGSTEVKKEHISYHSFCRDNRGRTYLTYNTGGTWNFERYTSEGNKESKTFTLPDGCHQPMLAGDHATGAVYLVAESGGNTKLYKIKEEGGSPAELTGVSIGYPTGCAVYNDILITSGYKLGTQDQELKMYRINGSQLSEITLSSPPDLTQDMQILLGGDAVQGVEIKDLYMTENSLYALFSRYEHSAQHFSLGGIVKYSYSADKKTIKEPKRIGIADSHTRDQNAICETNVSNFYGPVKVIGFDEEKLYIADDGVTFEKTDSDVIIKTNRNRIAALSRNGDSLSFKPAADAAWNNEENIKGTGKVDISIGDDGWKD